MKNLEKGMQLLIESKLKTYNRQKMLEFYWLQNVILSSKTEEQLRESFVIVRLKHFKIGFGGHHMWVSEIIRGEVWGRNMIVRFE
jgi:hypothetical protein